MSPQQIKIHYLFQIQAKFDPCATDIFHLTKKYMFFHFFYSNYFRHLQAPLLYFRMISAGYDSRVIQAQNNNHLSKGSNAHFRRIYA